MRGVTLTILAVSRGSTASSAQTDCVPVCAGSRCPSPPGRSTTALSAPGGSSTTQIAPTGGLMRMTFG